MYLAIEIGGTKLQLALGMGDGRLTALWRDTVQPAYGAEGIRRQILAGVPALLQQANLSRGVLRGVGIGFGGPVDDRRRTVIKSHQIGGWDDFPLAEWVGKFLGLPATLTNDADAAGLGEALFGAGKGFSPVFYITVGSGIGGGLIIHGEIHRGAGRGASEIGHLRMPAPGDADRWVPLEQLASGWAIQEAARQTLGTPVGGVPDVVRAVLSDDTHMARILDRARVALAEGICHVIALVCPERIILGGGVSLMEPELWLDPIRALVAERVFKPFANSYEIVPAQLGETMVLHGALALCARAFSREMWADGEWSI